MRAFMIFCISFAVLAAGTACGGEAQPTPPPESSGITSAAPTATSIPPHIPIPAPAVGAGTAPGSARPAACPGTAGWGAGTQEATGSTTDALYLVRADRLDCYDRVEFSVNGPGDTGFSVRYVLAVTADPSGKPLPVPGNALLQVVIRAPEQGADGSGHQPGKVLAQSGDYLYSPAQLTGWPTVRAVRFAGSFEGQCTFALGVRDRLPFRAFTVLDTVNQVRRIVVDIAH